MISIPHLFKGLLIGTACILPGLSGGTLAVSLGVYGSILHAVNNLSSQPMRSIKTLFPFALGGGLGILFCSLGFEFLFTRYPLSSNLVFLGLILGGVPSISRQIHSHISSARQAALSVLLCLLIFALVTVLTIFSSGGNELRTGIILEPSLVSSVLMFLTGILCAATMIIPGVSGSMLLLMLGLYTPLLTAIGSFLRFLAAGNLGGMAAEALILMPLALGLCAGTLLFARLMDTALRRYPAVTYSAILGLVLSSPAAILAELPPESLRKESIPLGVFLFSLALCLTLWAMRNTEEFQHT